MWDDVAPAFAGAHTTLAYDHRGHGQSPGDALQGWTPARSVSASLLAPAGPLHADAGR